MNISRKLAISGLIVVAVFAFGFGLAFVGEAQAEKSPCCYIPATAHCSAGIGTWNEDLMLCYIDLDPTNPTLCQAQVTPECW